MKRTEKDNLDRVNIKAGDLIEIKAIKLKGKTYTKVLVVDSFAEEGYHDLIWPARRYRVLPIGAEHETYIGSSMILSVISEED